MVKMPQRLGQVGEPKVCAGEFRSARMIGVHGDTEHARPVQGLHARPGILETDARVTGAHHYQNSRLRVIWAKWGVM
jgi:hypothetical protein